MMQRAGIEVGIITGRTSEAVRIRAEELGIERVRQGVFDKVAAWREMLDETGLSPEQSAYVGDDTVDGPLLRRGGASRRRWPTPRSTSCRRPTSSPPGGGGAAPCGRSSNSC